MRDAKSLCYVKRKTHEKVNLPSSKYVLSIFLYIRFYKLSHLCIPRSSKYQQNFVIFSYLSKFSKKHYFSTNFIDIFTVCDRDFSEFRSILQKMMNTPRNNRRIFLLNSDKVHWILTICWLNSNPKRYERYGCSPIILFVASQRRARSCC